MKKFFAFCLTLCLMLVLGGCVAGMSGFFPSGASASGQYHLREDAKWGYVNLDVDSATHVVKGAEVCIFGNDYLPPADLHQPDRGESSFGTLKQKDTKIVIAGYGHSSVSGKDGKQDWQTFTITIPGNVRDLGPGQSIDGEFILEGVTGCLFAGSLTLTRE